MSPTTQADPTRDGGAARRRSRWVIANGSPIRPTQPIAEHRKPAWKLMLHIVTGAMVDYADRRARPDPELRESAEAWLFGGDQGSYPISLYEACDVLGVSPDTVREAAIRLAERDDYTIIRFRSMDT